MSKKTNNDSVFQQDGKYYITVYHGANSLYRYLVTSDTFGQGIKKIVDDMLKEYPEGFDFDSEIKFVREVFEELK